MLTYINISLAILAYLSFAVGAYAFFANSDKAAFGMNIIKLLATAAAIIIVTAIAKNTAIPNWSQYLASALYCFSIFLFYWTTRANKKKPLTLAFASDQPVHITKDGPYKFVRHPYYSSYVISYVAGFFACQSPWVAIVVLTMTCTYIIAARFEEKKFLASSIKAEYQSYQSKTGMFIPKIGA